MNIKLIKAYRDLLARKGQTFVMILALSIGIIGAGGIFNAYNIMVREMQKNYDMTNPPYFIIKKENLSGDERQRIAGLSSEYKYEYRGIIEGRMLTPSGIWKTIVLEVVPDFNQVQINQFFTLKEEKYQSPNNQNSPGLMEVFIEKAAFPEAEQNIGNNMKILLPGSPIQEFKITGSYHAPALPPAWMENWVYGFISMETAQKLGFKDPLNRILVQSQNTIKTFQDAKNESAFFVEKIKNLGITDFTTEVPLPGVHPHAGQMNSLLYLLQVFGVIALIMASALTGNIISSILARQKREIGIMKSTGADRGQVLLILLIQIGIVGLIALLIAMPLARIIAVQYSYFTANILNFIIYDASIPLWSYALQIAIGLGIPLLMSLVPILRNSKITVREIITDYGINSQSRKKSWFKMPVIPGLTPYILSIRNTFRQKGRFVLMLVTLTVSGVLFLISQNVSQSIDVTVEDLFKAFKYDSIYTISLNNENKIKEFFAGRNEIASYEIWRNKNITDQDRQISVIAASPDTQMLNTQVKGNEAVVSQVYADIFKVKAGDTIRVKLENNFIVERRVREVINSFGEPTVFLDLTSLSENEKNALNPMSAILFNKQANAPKVTQNHLEKIFAQFNSDNKNNETNQEEIVVTASAALENNLNTAGFSVSSSRNRVELKESLIDHMQLIASFLLIMSFLTLFIGGLTIISSVSLSIMERRREIGILRSTGAPGKRITHLFILENWVIGFITFVLASVLAVPISELAGNTFGMIFLKMPLTPAIADHAVLLWFALTFLLTMIFSMIPARNAINSKLGSLLSYE